MKKKRILLGLALAATAVFSLSACNGEEKPEEPAPAEVDGDGDGEVDTRSVVMNGTTYESIKKAFAAIPASSTDTFTIVLGKGTYNEEGLQYNGSATIKIKGDTTTKYGADVIIKGHGSNMKTEKERSLIAIQGTGNIILENLTLQSDWTRTLAGSNNAQAEVLGTDTKGNTAAYNCSFKSNQDTIRTAGKAWFYGCYIEGDVDFLWMETAGQVALYEKCEIVSVYDQTASTHATYFTAPRMAKTMKIGKGLVIYNSTLTQTDEAKEKNQDVYLARNAWSGTTDYYNQVTYINTTVGNGLKVNSAIWKSDSSATDFDKTQIGFKMDQKTATAIGYAGNGDVLDDTTVSKEFNGRETIINRYFNTGKLKYEKDAVNYWDISNFITSQNWTVDNDTSKSVLDGEVVSTPTIYKFDGTEDVSAYVSGFAQDGTKAQFVGNAGSTITIPVTGKCYVEVYGFYSGTVETKAGSQGEAIMFFNNNTTNTEIENDYIVYDSSATNVTITAKGKTYITRIVVVEDDSITQTEATSIDVTPSTTNYLVGVALKLSAKVNPGLTTNKSVKWSSNNESVAKIDEYTGKVTFLTAGTVTFTATACDGSGTTGTFECTAKEAKWTEAEWYTVDSDTTGTEETKTGAEKQATEIAVFEPTSASKSLGTEYTFTNLKGQEIKTAYGLKMNSSGKLLFSTTKGNALLTLVCCDEINEKATPTVYTTDKSVTLTCVGQTTTKDANGKNVTTYLYEIPSAGAWEIYRGSGNECNPILYASVVYDLTISKNTFVNYKGGSFSAQSTDAVKLNHNSDTTDANYSNTAKVEDTNQVTYDNITYKGAVSNGNNGWLTFNTGATITFTAKTACTLYINFYKGNNNVTVTLDGNTITTPTSSEGSGSEATGNPIRYEYAISAGGTVVITAASNGYLGCFEVEFPSA